LTTWVSIGNVVQFVKMLRITVPRVEGQFCPSFSEFLDRLIIVIGHRFQSSNIGADQIDTSVKSFVY